MAHEFWPTNRSNIGDIAVDHDGNLIATAFAPLTASREAFLSDSCGAGAYLKLSPAGEQLFASWLPSGIYPDFAVTATGTPILQRGGEYFEVIEDRPAGVFTGCIVDGASFTAANPISPGAIVTLFGSQLGPGAGAAFELANGRLPTSLDGTQVFVNGEPVPLLYSSYCQVNAVLPNTLNVGSHPAIQVVSGGQPGNVLTDWSVSPAGVSIFRVDASPLRPAAALNEDGTVNSRSNPARRGSRIALFGTGGGSTKPPSTAGEITRSSCDFYGRGLPLRRTAASICRSNLPARPRSSLRRHSDQREASGLGSRVARRCTGNAEPHGSNRRRVLLSRNCVDFLERVAAFNKNRFVTISFPWIPTTISNSQRRRSLQASTSTVVVARRTLRRVCALDGGRQQRHLRRSRCRPT